MKKFLACLVLLLLLVSCDDSSRSKKEKNKLSYHEYVHTTTRGVISKGAAIELYLVKDIQGFETGEALDADLFELQPKLKGKLYLDNVKKLIFKPDTYFKSGTKYTATLKLGKLYQNVPKELSEFEFGFKTIEPNFTLETGDLQSYDVSTQYIEGTFKSADIVSLSDAKKTVSAFQEQRALAIQWHGDDKTPSTYFDFTIDSIQRLDNDSSIEVKWDGSAIDVPDNTGTSKVEIPGKSNFSLVNLYVRQHPEQHLRINFSDPIKKQQNLKGLVAIQNVKSLKYVVEGNVLKVYPDSRISGTVQVDVFSGIKNQEGYKLKNGFSEKIVFEQFKPAVALITNGVILPDSKNLTFNFKAVNLKAVDVRVIKVFSDNVLQFLQSGTLNNSRRYDLKPVGRTVARKTMPLVKNDLENDGKWKNYAVDISPMVETEPGAIYRVELSYRQAYSLYTCGEAADKIDYTVKEDDPIEQRAKSEREDAYWDSFESGYYDGDYDYRGYNWRDRENPCTSSYYYDRNRVGGNLLATNLGAIVKKGSDNAYFFAVTDILTAKPVQGAAITLYNFQQQVVGNTTTNEDGVSYLKLEGQAAFAIIKKEKNTTYLRLKEGEALSLSKFNVSGKRIKKGLKGYVYGERGVWRPGDTIHTVFVLNDKSNPLPQNHPVKMEVTDPHGQLQYQNISTNGVNGFYRFDIPTSDGDATGNWNAKISVGGAAFYKTLKVETVKPNRLKVNLGFNQEILSVQKPIQGNLDVKWLHGAPAKNLKTEVNMKLTASNSGFASFPGYVFKDPIKKFSSEELLVFDGKIDSLGMAKFVKKVNLKSSAPGLLKASFLTRVFENGGDFSTNVSTKSYAPFKSFVGLKSPKSKRYGNSYITDQNVAFGIATVDAKGKPIARKNLEVEIYKIRWSWWWNSSSDNLASYVNKRHNTLYKTFKVNTNADGTGVANIKIPDTNSGRYLIRIKDPISGHATGRTAYFFRDWWSNTSDKGSEAATMLVFSADKEKYQVGEEAQITFPSSEGGNALVTVENSSEVISSQWVQTQKGTTTAVIPVTSEMTPNVFVNISLLQPHATQFNDLPLRLYGVIPMMVEDPATRIEPQISMPEELKPERSFEVKVSEKSGKKMTYTLSVVEEGLLDLTNYKTPNLWNVFYTREALGVQTWDVFDDVVGAFGGTINQVFAIGGDEDRISDKKNKANRFKPVVKVLGPFELEAGTKATHTIKLPNYIGSVRTMVVAADNSAEAYGKVEKATPVRKPLMVLATLPRKLSPGEKVTLPVTVFAMQQRIKDVKVSLKLSDGLRISGKRTKSLHFENPDEKMLYFDLDVQQIQGKQTVEVLVEGHGEKASQKVALAVINPNPVSSEVIDLQLEPNKTLTHNFGRFGEPGTNTSVLEISTLPPMNFAKRLEYLIQYPHGCVEQTTSSVFPQLFLSSIFDLDYSKKQHIKENIKKGIKRLSKFQLTNGGLSYWIGNESANEWGTNYAGHFMLEAQKKGYALPLTFLSNWLRYQKQAARNWRPGRDYTYTDMVQAYRLYTLALAGAPDLAAMNRLREYTLLSDTAKWRLAAAYALSGQPQAAKELQQRASLNFNTTQRDYYTYGSEDRNKAMALETLLLIENENSYELAKQIAKRLSSNNWMSTQTTAYCLLSMAKMVEKNGGRAMDVRYEMNGTPYSVQTENAVAQRDLKITESGTNQFTITNNKANVVYVRILNSGVLPLGSEMTAQRNFKLYVKYVDSEANRVPVAKLKQGTDFVALVTISNPNKERINDIALSQLFPSGWEIVNTRFTDFGEGAKNKADYTDIRDDRVNFYFSLKKNEVRTFKVLLNASYLGKYYLPGVQAEAMYDNDYFARSKGRWVEVVK